MSVGDTEVLSLAGIDAIACVLTIDPCHLLRSIRFGRITRWLPSLVGFHSPGGSINQGDGILKARFNHLHAIIKLGDIIGEIGVKLARLIEIRSEQRIESGVLGMDGNLIGADSINLHLDFNRLPSGGAARENSQKGYGDK